MKGLLASFLLFAQCLLSPASLAPNQGRPIPPGMREADKQTNSPLDAPLAANRKAPDPAKLQQEAGELAKLSAAVPSQIALVNQGQMPKDLGEQLKRIEKLAKHLRSEVLP